MHWISIENMNYNQSKEIFENLKIEYPHNVHFFEIPKKITISSILSLKKQLKKILDTTKDSLFLITNLSSITLSRIHCEFMEKTGQCSTENKKILQSEIEELITPNTIIHINFTKILHNYPINENILSEIHNLVFHPDFVINNYKLYTLNGDENITNIITNIHLIKNSQKHFFTVNTIWGSH